MTTTKPIDYSATARQTINIEMRAIESLLTSIDEHFVKACDLLLECEGRIVVTGMGKSGHIGRKIAATFSSTGSPAFFVHPGEASHGDLGMITRHDVVLAISNSGGSAEVLAMMPAIKRIGCPVIALTGIRSSPLAKLADTHIDIAVPEEACPLGLAPTSSTTATLVMGDALAINLLEARGFTANDFALSHPSGAIGKRLLTKVDELMHCGDELPQVPLEATLKEALLEMTKKGLGMTTVVTADRLLVGVFTDGDLRRIIDKENFIQLPISAAMTKQPKTISKDLLAVEAVRMMEQNKITSLVVVDNQQRVSGVIHTHDLLQAGIL